MPRFPLPNLLLLLHIFAITAVLSSCGSKEQRAAPMPESANAYLFSYTSGVISKTSPVRVRFASAVATGEQVGQPAEGIFQLKPAVDGQAVWEDTQTLLFQPAQHLQSGTAYVATVQLGKLFAQVPKEAQVFEFDFRTNDLQLSVNIGGLRTPDVKDLTKQELTGTAYTTDFAESESVEAALTAVQDGKERPIRWEHGGRGTEHYFYIENITRKEKSSEVAVELDYDGFNQSGNQSLTFVVPALGDFELTNVQVNQGQEMYLELYFSDPLDAAQDFNGLVTIENYSGTLRYLADGNRLRVYPASGLMGTRKISVSKGLKNSMGSPMKKAGLWEVDIQDAKPQVRLVGSGVILPNTDKLAFPFEAINLNTVVVEVFKIYHNNILQFLQDNALNGGYDLRQVGRLIKQVNVPLQSLNPATNSNAWTRYAISLDELVEADPQAIYQIRVGFRPEHTTYQCTEALSSQGNEAADGELQSIMENWYGFAGYYDGFSWDHREDPCKPAYYNADRFVQRNVIASNIGLLAKSAEARNCIVYATDLRTAQPLSGVALEFYDYQQQQIGSGTTDGNGRCQAQLPREPFVVVAKQGQERGYLRLQDGDALSLSKFDVEGAKAQKGLKGFLYADRGVWRPGDSVYLNFILEDALGKLPQHYPVAFELRDPRGQVRETRTVTNRVPMVYPLHFATASDAPTGIWRATVKAGGANFSKSLRIETVKPNRFKINLDFGKERISSANAPFTPQLQANWLHGAPASGMDAKIEAQLQPVNTTFPGRPDFEFDDPARSFSMEPRAVWEGTLNEDGAGSPSFSLSSQQELPGRLMANFQTRVFERGGGFSTDNFSLGYDPYPAYAGLAIPKDQYGSKRIIMNEPTGIPLTALDPEGKPLANRKLSVGLYRVDWRWWWDRGNGNISRYNTATHYGAMQKTELTTGQDGNTAWLVNVSDWGRYMVRVCDTETGHCAGDFFYAGSPWYGDQEGNREAAAMLPFTADQERYDVGETVTLRLPEAKAGRVLVSLETGSEVLQSFWVDAKAGENKITFEATPDMAPTAYAHITLLQPHGQVENDLPIRLYGVIPVNVEDPATHLQPAIEMAKELKPKQGFTVKVSEKEGRPMAYTLAVVDEGLLGLTRFETPAPWKHFYAREALGVRTWDLYDDVLGAYGGQLDQLLSIGGDAAAKVEAAKKANRFDPVAMHLGPFYLKKGATTTHTLRMPNYVGAVRVMVVAAEQEAYGQTEQSVPVRQPLMVLGTLPRVLGPGESLQLPVNVFAMQEGIRDVKVTVQSPGSLIELAEPSKRIQFQRAGDQLINFPVQVADRIGVAKFTITAEGGGHKASQEIEIQVRNPNPYVTDVGAQALDPGASHQYAYQLPGMTGTNEVVLEVSSLPPIDLERRLRYLIRYPYGCLEQTLSGGFPQLYVNDLLEVNEEQKKQTGQNIKATINRLALFQLPNGGMAYWPGNSQARTWATTYAGHFLLEAKALGYFVPPTLLDNWITYQQETARLWSAEADSRGLYQSGNQGLDQAYRLYSLALAQAPDLAAMNRLRSYDNLNTAAKWRLAGAYALTGKRDIAKQLVGSTDRSIQPYRELGATFGSRLRDQAMILETLVLLKDLDAAAELVRTLSDELSSSNWLNTQETAYSLLAIGKFVKAKGSGTGEKVAFQYTANGQTTNAGSDKPVLQIELPDNTTAISVTNTSGGLLFTRVVRRGQPLVGKETASNSKINMTVTYKNMAGAPIDPGTLPQGADFLAEVTLTHPGNQNYRTYEELALEQIFPSGWEIMNTRLSGFSSTADEPEYQDIRDDRVQSFFDLGWKKSKTFRVQLNAAYQGRFYLPATRCAAMYKHDIEARTAGQWVEVGLPGAI
ncbi:MAG: MG2 domain-containing protein [Phaeodactylibacter sp.]|uniref:alpha-2-macroglobulin family protein n=1 Tax=Phaeodactylibacter sp. TaxID=1940289 RepID=UPI0032F053BB